MKQLSNYYKNNIKNKANAEIFEETINESLKSNQDFFNDWINEFKKNGFKEDLFKHLIEVCNESLNILKDIINEKYQKNEINKNLYDKLINACTNQALNQKQYFDEVGKNGGFA